MDQIEPKFIEDNCDVCGTKLTPFALESENAMDDEWYCSKCEDVVPDWSPEQIASMMPDNPDLCVELGDIEDDLSDEIKEVFAEIKSKFPDDYKIMITPQTLQQMFIMSAEDKKKKNESN